MKSACSTKDKVVIFTDLDGSLLDYHTYSSELVAPVVARLKQAGVAIVFCSSKTRSEQEVYRRRLGIADPFIVEDGGAIFIKPDYFHFTYKYDRIIDGYQVIELGMPYDKIKQILERVRQQHKLNFTGFGDMDTAQVAAATGLDLALAELARKREYEETLILTGPDSETVLILKHIEAAGLRWTKGTRFYGVIGDNDKGMAAKILMKLFKQKLNGIKTIGIGDSLNDLPMLTEVDFPVLVQKPGGRWEEIDLPGLKRAAGVGPEGWIMAVNEHIRV